VRGKRQPLLADNPIFLSFEVWEPTACISRLWIHSYHSLMGEAFIQHFQNTYVVSVKNRTSRRKPIFCAAKSHTKLRPQTPQSLLMSRATIPHHQPIFLTRYHVSQTFPVLSHLYGCDDMEPASEIVNAKSFAPVYQRWYPPARSATHGHSFSLDLKWFSKVVCRTFRRKIRG
jgi:hypothetical protein